MADRPILFSAPMVRATLSGRKTQTRRILTLGGRSPDYCGPRGCTNDPTCWGWEDHNHGDRVTLEKEPGQRMGWRDWVGAPRVGDRLWVREQHYLTDDGEAQAVVYTEDNDAVTQHHSDIARLQAQYGLTDAWAAPHLKIRPSIHMPRWASRLTLIVTDVRVLRLQEITDADAQAEGIERLKSRRGFYDPTKSKGVVRLGEYFDWATDAFEVLWNSLHGPEAWDANPWVCALTFTVHHCNIDQMECEK